MKRKKKQTKVDNNQYIINIFSFIIILINYVLPINYIQYTFCMLHTVYSILYKLYKSVVFFFKVSNYFHPFYFFFFSFSKDMMRKWKEKGKKDIKIKIISNFHIFGFIFFF